MGCCTTREVPDEKIAFTDSTDDSVTKIDYAKSNRLSQPFKREIKCLDEVSDERIIDIAGYKKLLKEDNN